jgi:hypothetical protein
MWPKHTTSTWHCLICITYYKQNIFCVTWMWSFYRNVVFIFVCTGIYCFVVLFSVVFFCEFYFFKFSGLEVLFIKRTELTLLPLYLELVDFTSLTSERQHYLTGEEEARFHYCFYIFMYDIRIVLNENKTETKQWKFWSIFYTPCKNVFLMLIIELCLICWLLCCITNSLLGNKIAVTY